MFEWLINQWRALHIISCPSIRVDVTDDYIYYKLNITFYKMFLSTCYIAIFYMFLLLN
jgi:hypothetical protein